MKEKKKMLVEYPLKKGKISPWSDPEYRKQWNRKYREELKDGTREVVKRSEKPSKWKDPLYRKAYDEARKKKLKAEKKQSKMDSAKKPNFTKEEKAAILEHMIQQIRDGQSPENPFYELGLVIKPEFQRKLPKKNLSTSDSIKIDTNLENI